MLTFMMRFLGLLIRDLDNPFGYYEAGSTEDVSLKPIDDVVARLKEIRAHVSQKHDVAGTADHEVSKRPGRLTSLQVM
jgi:hypothetical protein